MRRLRQEHGMITIFFTGLLSLLLILVAVLSDYLRVEAARSEILTGLKLSSRLALSGFDKKLAREYGLFAISDLEVEKNRVAEAWLERLAPSENRKTTLVVEARAPEIHPVEGAILAKPKCLEEQIASFMSWQTPQLLFDALCAQTRIFEGLSQLGPVLTAKTAYEKGLKKYHDLLAQLGKQMDGLPVVPEGWQEIRDQDRLLKGAGSLQAPLAQLQTQFHQLEDLFLTASTGEKEKSEEGPSEEGPTPAQKQALRQAFDQVKALFSEQGERLDQTARYIQDTGSALQSALGEGTDLKGEANRWGASIKGLPAGSLANAYYADYWNKTSTEHFSGLDQFAQEWGSLHQELKQKKTAWDHLTWAGLSMKELTFEQFLKKAESRIHQDTYATMGGDQKILLKEHWLSKEAIQLQGALRSLHQEKRSGLLEFIQAWNQKRKMKRAAKWADQAGMSHLAKSISDQLGAEKMKRYQMAVSGPQAGQALQQAMSLGGDAAILEGLSQGLEAVGQSMKPSSLLEESARLGELFCYWTEMFSHRTSPFLEKKAGTKRLSLTGYPLCERAYYRGEQEYLLYGHDLLTGNIKQAALEIAGLRLLLNACYAFSSAELYQETMAAAVALAGWSSFGVPFVQSALLGIIAIGETKLDMDDLLAGKALPVYKSPTSWRFSLHGIRPLVQSAVGAAFDGMMLELEAGGEALIDQAREAVSGMSQSAKGLVYSAIKTPVLGWFNQKMSALVLLEPQKEAASWSALLQEMAARDLPGPLKAPVKDALVALQGRGADVLAQLTRLREKKAAAGRLTEGVMKEVQAVVDGLVDPLCQKAEGGIAQLSRGWDQQLSGFRSLAEDQANQALAGFLSKFEKAWGGSASDQPLTLAGGLNMDYSAYLRLFFFLKMTTGQKDQLLVRTAQLVDSECGGLDLTQAPTALKWTGQDQVILPVLGRNPIWSDRTRFGSGAWPIQVKWQEGYGSKAWQVAP